MKHFYKRVTGRLLRPAACAFAIALAFGPAAAQSIPAEVQSALDRISADSLRGHVSFLASDLLEGRATPSPGLEVAAEYITAQFRRAGLKEPENEGYAQIARMMLVKRDYEDFGLTFDMPKESIRIGKENAAVRLGGGLEISRVPVLKIDFAAALERLTSAAVEGKVLAGVAENAEQVSAVLDHEGPVRTKLLGMKPAALVVLTRERLRNDSRPVLQEPGEQIGTPVILVNDSGLFDAFESLENGTASVRLRPPQSEPVALRNVIGVLPGSDPVLRNTYVLVTAHYDHIGMELERQPDPIFNGANDNASGTASVIEIASALTGMMYRPLRSIVFMTFFGEEDGFIGSRYYTRHPVLPLDQTVAQLNIEETGRTDDNDGPQISKASVTGFDYSDMGETLRQAGDLLGVTVYKHHKNSDEFFARSDNEPFATRGIPAHTIGVSFMYPDYHRPGDEWQKLDYENMAKITRAIALGVLAVANNPEPPKWIEANPSVAPYLKAQREKESASRNSSGTGR